jgi:hypothetical protein
LIRSAVAQDFSNSEAQKHPFFDLGLYDIRKFLFWVKNALPFQSSVLTIFDCIVRIHVVMIRHERNLTEQLSSAQSAALPGFSSREHRDSLHQDIQIGRLSNFLPAFLGSKEATA